MKQSYYNSSTPLHYTVYEVTAVIKIDGKRKSKTFTSRDSYADCHDQIRQYCKDNNPNNSPVFTEIINTADHDHAIDY